VSTGRHRLSARDYKHAGKQPHGFDFARYQQFGIGLALGLAVALGVWIYHLRATPADGAPLAAEAEAKPRASASTGDSPEETADPAADYDFYDMLPKFEVVVGEQERNAHRDLPSEPVKQPGNYVLQVGSYRNLEDAQRLRARLSKLGIDANIQKVAIDADEWHRVRIGPVKDLAKLNATRSALRKADIDAIIYQVGD
jgi:cell division protein FtsN